MSYEATKSLLKRIFKLGFKVERIIADQLGPTSLHEKIIRQVCDSCADENQSLKKVSITSESKADDTYPVVSAASIVAKVTRDKVLNDWIFAEQTAVVESNLEEDFAGKFEREWGCGYPSDPLTKAWIVNSLDAVFGYPTLVRFSWKTCKDALEKQTTSKINWHDLTIQQMQEQQQSDENGKS